MSQLPRAARALPLLALLLAAGATAQTGYADLDRRVAALERTVAAHHGQLYVDGGGYATTGTGVFVDGGYATTGTGVYADDLDAERREFQDALRAYQAEVRAFDAEATRVRDDYDRLARYGGSAAERDAYDAARFRLEDDARRLAGEAAALNEWTADLSTRLRQRAHRPPTARSMELRRRVAQRRIADQRAAAQLHTRTRSTRSHRTHSHRTTRHH